MKKQAKPKTNRTQVKDLNVAQQELTTSEATKVQGGTTAGNRSSEVLVGIDFRPNASTTSSSTLSATQGKK